MGFDPMDIRYYLLSINYRTRIQFSLDALKGAKNARLAVVRRVGELGTKKGSLIPEYIDRFKEALRDNLNMSKAVAILNELLKLDGPKEDILATVLDLDRVLGLDLDRAIVEKDSAVDSEVEKLLNLREKAKLAKNYQASDRLRDEILKLGYIVKDTLQGQKVEKV
jgi:cysteinyl-tRNA synthetase